jgi:Zn ribbon nucleic-acid-binding protein
MGFRWPDGVGNVEHDGDDIRIQISMPTDEHGFLGRKCPSCSQLFRIDADAYQALGHNAELWCVYCGHDDEHSAFITDQQLNRAMRPIGDWAEQSFNQMLSDTFGKVPKSRSRSGIGIEITYRSDPFYPQPLPGINEEELVRIRTCTSCGMRYAVFGEHRYCPVCGPLSAEVVAADALDAETSRLDALNLVPLRRSVGCASKECSTAYGWTPWKIWSPSWRRLRVLSSTPPCLMRHLGSRARGMFSAT